MTRRRALALLALLLAATAGVFSSSLHADFTWDDNSLIRNNRALRGEDAWSLAAFHHFWDTDPPQPAYPIYWRPVVKLSHVALWKMGGGSPFPFHVASLLLHLACVALTFFWLRERARLAYSEDVGNVAGLAGAALFALHTTRFEPVPWVSGATDVWMTLFVLAAAITVRKPWWWLAPILGALAMLSKEAALALPVLLALDGWLAPAQRIPWKRIVAVAIGTALPLIPRVMLGFNLPTTPDYATAGERVMRSLGSFAAYHSRIVPQVPTINPFDIDRVQHGMWLVPWWLAAAGAVLAIGWAIAWLAFKRTRVFLADACWWLLPIAPVLQLKTVPSVTFCSDRYMYFPLLGVCALMAPVAAWALANETRRTRFALAFTGAIAVCALQLALAVPSFRNNLTLLEREYEQHPDSAFIVTGYAGALQEVGFFRVAQKLREHAVELAQTPLEHDMALIDLAFAEDIALRDIDREELLSLMQFIDAVQNPDVPAPPLVIGEQRWPLMNPLRAGALAVQLSRGGDLELLSASLRWRVLKLEDALTKSEVSMEHPTVERRRMHAQILAARGDWVGARNEVKALIAERPEEANNRVMHFLSEAEDPAWSVPYTVEWSTLRRAAMLVSINAISEARFVLKDAGDSRDVLRARVQVEVFDRNFDGAIKLLSEEIEKSPDNADLIPDRKDVEDLQKRYSEAGVEEIARWAPGI